MTSANDQYSANSDASEQRFPAYRPLMPAVVAFALGVMVGELSGLPPSVAWSAALGAATVFPVAMAWGMRRVGLGALYLLIVSVGWLWLDADAGTLPAHHLAHYVGQGRTLVRVRGTVAAEPQVVVMSGLPLSGESKWLSQSVERLRLDMAASGVEVGEWVGACGRVRATVYNPPRGLRYGDELEATGMVFRPSPATNPGQLDMARYLRRKGIRVGLSADGAMVRVLRRGLGWWPQRVAGATRARLRRVLNESLGRDELARSLLGAALLGDRTELDEEFEESFKRSGTMHLLAISGLHVGIVAWLVWGVAALAGLGRSASGALVLAVVSLYAMMVGLTPSVLRAAVMTGALVLSIMGRRQLDLLQATALAALVVLLIRPFDLFHVGFQLSFAAVVAIVCVYGELAALLRPGERLERKLLDDAQLTRAQRLRSWLGRRALGAVSVSGGAWLGVFPLTAYYFHLFSPITVLANLVAVPLLTLVVVLGFPHVVLGAAWPLVGAGPGWLAAWAARGLTAVVGASTRVPLAWTYCAMPALGWVVAYYVLGLVVVGRRRIGLSGPHAAILWVAGLIACQVATFAAPRPEHFEVTALDVQHGNSAVLRYPDGATVVCDCGSYGRSDVGKHAVAPALWHWGVQRIDLIVVSHADVDHINGIPALLERFAVGHVLYSPVVERSVAGRQLIAMLRARGIAHGPAQAGDRIVVGRGNVLEVLGPTEWTLRAFARNQNENSLVVRATHGGRRVLVTGDIQVAGSASLLGTQPRPQADVLIVPHHGCAMANTPEFAKAVRPAIAICSNRADHMIPATVDAYEQAGASVFATCWHGAVTVAVRDGVLHVSPFMASEPQSTHAERTLP